MIYLEGKVDNYRTKKLMFDIEDAKLPPPKPESNASSWKIQSGVLLSDNAIPVPSAGIISSAVVKKIVFLPPAILMKNVLGIRSVAPVKPAIAASVNSSLCSNGNPKFSI